MPYVRTHANQKRLHGLLAAILPAGSVLLPNNRRVRTLSAYDSRARHLTGFLGDDDGDDSFDFSDIISSGDADSLYPTYYGGSGTAIIPTANDPVPIAPSLPASATGIAPTGIIQSTGQPTYLPSYLMYPNSGPIPAGATVNPNGTISNVSASGAAIPNVNPITGLITGGAVGTSTVLPSGQVVATGQVAGGQSIAQWLAGSSIIAGWSNQSVLFTLGIGAVALSMLSKKKKRR